MQPDEFLKRAGLGVLIFSLVLAGGLLVAGEQPAETPPGETQPVDAYDTDGMVADVPADTGAIELTANATEKVVVIDTSHGATLDRNQLTPLVETLTDNGAEVRFLTAENGGRHGPESTAAFNASLRNADAFLAFGAEQQYTQKQINGLERFADAGGRVLITKEPARMQPSILIFGGRPTQQAAPMPLAPLGSRFGVSFGNGYLFNMHEYDTNYRDIYAAPTTSGQLTAGVDRLVFHEATPVRGPKTVVRSTEGTELSETRKEARYGVVVQSGNLTVVGDSSIFGQEYVRRGDNEIFAGNILDFLVGGTKTPQNAPAPPESTEQETHRNSPTRPAR